MLVNIQKKLDAVSCPSCGKAHVLQASFSCSRDEKVCEPICQCKECGLVLNVQLPIGTNQINENDSLSMSCNLETTSCQVEIKKAG